MSRLVVRPLGYWCLLLAITVTPRQATARQTPPALSDSALVATVNARSIGPAVMSGRVVDIAVAESPGTQGGSLGTVFYIAAATGGVWKTTNGGMSWTAVFDDAGVGSVGDVTVAPSNSNIVWVGTGEPNNMRSSSYGDGVYKSLDGGATFTHMGLRTSQHVGRIVIHPTDPDIVFVAAVGPLWGPGGERGLYKTTDGGRTWHAVLTVDEHTGVTDVVLDPTDPDRLYAATLQRERRAYSYVGGGPGSGIHRSTDGGETWTRVTAGLPTSDMGRIGLDIVRSQPRTLYAVIEGSEGGVYRSDDHGTVWRRASDISSIPWYFGQIRADPNDPETVYHLGVPLQRSTDGGATWTRIARQVHVDHHALWISPANSDHLILGNDGGLYVSHDGGTSWDFSPNLPLSQFYAVGYDMREPFFGLYGGLQDNNTWGGPSRTRYRTGVRNADWQRMAGGDGFFAAIDPTDHTIAYVESQNGFIRRFDARTGESRAIRPAAVPGEAPYRYNWSAPIRVSPHDARTIYFAANYVFKSTDRGDTWTRLGEDLTRAIDRDSLPMMGAIPARDAVARHSGTAVFSNISALDVSARQPGLLATGSDDGVVAVSRDDGVTWQRTMRFPGVPDTTYVSDVAWSKHEDGVLYATFDGHRSNDFRPYVLRSADYGRSWERLASNLPAFGSIRSFVEHHANPNLLFVGTEVAPFVSVDRGASWTRLHGGIPPAPVHDLAIHPRENTLIVATHGRGFFLIDDLAPLEHLAAARAANAPTLLPVRSALALAPSNAASSGTHADRDYRGANPPVGTRISFLLPTAVHKIQLDVVDDEGARVRRWTKPTAAGLHHVAWDLRVETPWSGPPDDDGDTPRGPLVEPGTYTARLTVTVDSTETTTPTTQEQVFAVRPDPGVRLTAAEQRDLYDVRRRVARLAARTRIARRAAEQLEQQLAQAREAMQRVDDLPTDLTARGDSLKAEVDSILIAIRGPRRSRTAAPPDTVPAPSVQRRGEIASGVNSASALPTAVEREALATATEDLGRLVERLNELIQDRVRVFWAALDEAGVPWTPGRPVR